MLRQIVGFVCKRELASIPVGWLAKQQVILVDTGLLFQRGYGELWASFVSGIWAVFQLGGWLSNKQYVTFMLEEMVIGLLFDSLVVGLVTTWAIFQLDGWPSNK